MFDVCHCKVCGSSTIPLNQASCSLVFTTSTRCDSCHESKTYRYSLWFCSARCLVEYMATKDDVLLRNVAKFEEKKHFPTTTHEMRPDGTFSFFSDEED